VYHCIITLIDERQRSVTSYEPEGTAVGRKEESLLRCNLAINRTHSRGLTVTVHIYLIVISCIVNVTFYLHLSLWEKISFLFMNLQII
jgi:hypothetical protein